MNIKLKGISESLNIPDGYRKLEAKLKAKLANYDGYEKITSNSQNVILIFPTTPKKAMNFEDVDGLINGINHCLSEKQALIQVENGLTEKGRRYIYSIVKNQQDFFGVRYFLRMNIEIKNKVFEIQADFTEIGTTGMRDNVILATLQNEGKVKFENDELVGWWFDPYNPDNKDGYLMNLSEKEEYDSLFIEHPLSQARQLIAVIKNDGEFESKSTNEEKKEKAENKKLDINKVAEDAGKNVMSLLDKAKDSIVKVVDQNSDGSFDREDISAIAEKIGEVAKNTTTAVIHSAEEKSREIEKSILQPIFVEDLNSADFFITKLIRLTDIDKRYSESEVCHGAIGYMTTHKDLKIINIFRHKMDEFGLTFIPDTESEVYYVDPSDRNKYIALEDYFEYLRTARVNELQKIAQDLGAKHFKVTYKEHKVTFSSSKSKGKATAKKGIDNASAEAERDLSSKEVSTVEIAAEMDCPGHEPFEPKLCYLQREQSIQSLISLRMDKASPMFHQKYTLKLSNSSGIKEKDAIKIDAALKAMKINGNTTVVSEVQNESRRFFEYEVDF